MNYSLEAEIKVAHMLARTCKKRIAVVQVHSIIVSILYDTVEAHELVLYVTI